MISHLSFPFSLLLVLSLSALHSCTPYLPCHLRILQQHAAQTLRSAQQARPVSVLPPRREPHKAPPESLPCIICATRMTALRNHAAEGYRRGGGCENEPNGKLVLLVFSALLGCSLQGQPITYQPLAPPPPPPSIPSASLPILSILLSHTCLTLCRLSRSVKK